MLELIFDIETKCHCIRHIETGLWFRYKYQSQFVAENTLQRLTISMTKGTESKDLKTNFIVHCNRSWIVDFNNHLIKQ
jgi:hypothetical protein